MQIVENTLPHANELLPQIDRMLPRPRRIAIKARRRILFIDPADVVTVEAQGNYVMLRRTSGSELLRETISTISERLSPFGFVRIHRSVLINSSYVEEIHPSPAGEYVLTIQGGKQFNVSRTYKKNLQSITTLWLGTDAFRTR